MAFTYVTLTAGSGYRHADGTVARAKIIATPYVAMTNGTITVDQPVSIPLTSGGAATKTIAATTDPATLPVGNAYRFRVEVNGYAVRRFIAALPHNVGSVDIDDLTELEEPPDLTPVGGGDGAVASVNGQTGTVVLDADDLADGASKVQMTTAERTKLSGVATGATAYTAENARDDIGTTLVAGANVTITPNDGADTITITAATTGAAGIPASIVDVKGDLIVATAADTVARLAVGSNGQVLKANSAATTGLEWGTGGSGAVDSVNGSTGVVVLTPDSFTDATTNKVYTATEKTKLAGIASAATANSADATLLARANHTGSQAISTVTGLQTALDGKPDSASIDTITVITQSAYDALGTPNATTLYVITA